MKPEDQQIAIGEAVGWKRHTDKEHQYSGSHLVVEGWIRQKPGTTGLNTFDFEWRDSWNLPDYLNDLNAIQEAVLKLSEEIQHEWMRWLDAILDRDLPSSDPDLWEYQFWRISATAAQRSEALIHAVGKWVD